MTQAEKNEKILAELERLYPDAKPALHFDNPYQLLVAVILSAQCTDVKVNMVTPALFAAYPDAAAMAKATAEEIEPYIKTCGIYRNKAKNLALTARELVSRFGGEVPADHEALTTPRRRPQDRQRRDELRLRRGRHCRGYARVPRVQPPWSGRCAGCAQDRGAAHAGHPAQRMEPRASLADLSRTPGLRRAQARLRNLLAARMVPPSGRPNPINANKPLPCFFA